MARGNHIHNSYRERAKAFVWASWPRRLTVIGIVLVTMTAMAFLAFRKDTAPDTFRAQAIGQIDIGNAETDGIFYVDISDLEPGQSKSSCVNALVIDPQPGDDPRIFVAGVSGVLADHLEITARLRTDAEVTTAGQAPTDCPGSASYTVWHPLTTLTGFGTAWPDYETGQPFTFASNAQVKLTVVLDADADVEAVMGQEASLSLAFENRRATP